MNEIILINISGEDKPGLTSSLTSILSSYGVNILDIGQAVIHETLSLGMVVEVPANSATVFRDLLFKAPSAWRQCPLHAQFRGTHEKFQSRIGWHSVFDRIAGSGNSGINSRKLWTDRTPSRRMKNLTGPESGRDVTKLERTRGETKTYLLFIDRGCLLPRS
jgi:predicted amino acid-binding ACT domain protein